MISHAISFFDSQELKSFFSQKSFSISIEREQILIFKIETSDFIAYLTQLYALLSPEEIDRSNRYATPALQQRAVINRSILKLLLSGITNINPKEIIIGNSKYGKPFISRVCSPASDVQFNLSHTADTTLFAFSIEKQLGIDLERYKPNCYFEDLIGYVLSESELEIFNKIHNSEKERIFFSVWTQKEAITKALGIGLSAPLTNISLEMNHNLGCTSYDFRNLRVYDISVERTFFAALAVEI